MITPQNGRGLQPKVRASTTHLWTMDAVASPDLVVGGTALTNPGGASAPTLALGRLGNATLYDGAVDYLVGPTGESASFQDTFTLEVWLMPHYTQAGNAAVVNYSEVGATGVSLARNNQLELDYNVDRTLTWRWERTAAAAVVTQTSTAKLPMYQWSHVALTRGATYGGGVCDVNLYINGALVQTWPGQLQQEGGTDAAVKWYVGRSQASAFFTGYINCIAFHEEVLTAADIRQSFRRGFQWEPGSFDTRVKVVASQYTVFDAGTVTPEPVELTNFRGEDWVQSVEISDNVDATCATAKLSVFREVFKNSLAPEMDTSPLNLFDNNAPSAGFLERPNPGAPGPDDLTISSVIDNWRLVEIYAARVPMGGGEGSKPSAVEWQSVFKGRIDKFDWAGDVIQITLRDQASALEDMWIENQNVSYAAPAPGTALVTAVNAMIAANWQALNPSAAPVMVAPYPPATMLLDPWTVSYQSFMDQILPLADNIGYSLKFKWNPFTTAWEWTLFDPHRLRQSVDGVFEKQDVLQYQTVQQDLTSTRNAVRIGYKDDNGAYQDVTRVETDLPPFSQTSTRQYGRRFISISEKTTTQINNDAEANAMADAVLYDLLIPYADKAVTMKCFWEAEVGDRYTFLANDIHYSSDFTGAVTSVTHRWSQESQAITIMQLRGRPASAWKRHIDKGGGPRTGVKVPPGTLENVTTDISDRVRDIPFQSFLDMGLPTPVLGDATTSTPNPYFDVHPDYDNNAPPGWEPIAGKTWGSGKDVYWGLLNSESGDTTISLLTTGAGIQSQLFLPVIATRCLRVSVRWDGTDAASELDATIDWYTRDKVLISASQAFSETIAAVGTFQTDFGVVSPPSTARYYKLRLTSAGPGIVYIDRHLVTPIAPSFFVYSGAAQTSLSAGAVTVAAMADNITSAYDYCSNWNNATSIFTVPERGQYTFNGAMMFTKAPSGGTVTNGHVFLYKNGSLWLSVASVDNVSTDALQLRFNTPAIELVAGDLITLRGRVDTNDYNIVNGISYTWLSGQYRLERFG